MGEIFSTILLALFFEKFSTIDLNIGPNWPQAYLDQSLYGH